MIEILCSGLEGQMLLQLTSRIVWCPMRDSNSQPSTYRNAALPVVLTGLNWSQWLDSNQRYLAPKASDLARLAYTEIVCGTS